MRRGLLRAQYVAQAAQCMTWVCARTVTRCRDYDPALGGDYQAHVSHGGDAGLRFHSDAGAAIGELVPDYRPRDAQNLGYGVMVCCAAGPRPNSLGN
jgi:hypothetical protein